MNIAVVDVAAESGGALSVLNDFLNYIKSSKEASDHNWFVFTSIPLTKKEKNIINVICTDTKTSWFKRLKWDNFDSIQLFSKYQIDVIFSLQNTGFLRAKNIRQVVYFHNVLLLADKNKYSFFKSGERKYSIYTRLIAPYTFKTLKNVDSVICQTYVVKNELKERIPNLKVAVVPPYLSIARENTVNYKNTIKGLLYPTSAVPFKQIQELIECVRINQKWFKENDYEVLITLKGDENAYASKMYKIGHNISSIKFIGYQSRKNIAEIYKDHCLYINSEMESYPIPFLEANYFGAPIIAADYDYAKEITKDVRGKTFLFKKHDVHSMFKSIKDTVNCEISGPNNIDTNNTWEKVKAIILHRK